MQVLVNKQPFPKDFLVNYLMSNTEIACCLFNKNTKSLLWKTGFGDEC